MEVGENSWEVVIAIVGTSGRMDDVMVYMYTKGFLFHGLCISIIFIFTSYGRSRKAIGRILCDIRRQSHDHLLPDVHRRLIRALNSGFGCSVAITCRHGIQINCGCVENAGAYTESCETYYRSVVRHLRFKAVECLNACANERTITGNGRHVFLLFACGAGAWAGCLYAYGGVDGKYAKYNVMLVLK